MSKTPEGFNERYTVWLNADGNPVERTLQEMTRKEVMVALQFLEEQCDRMERETAEFSALAEAMQRGEVGPDDLSDAEVDALPAKIEALQECGEAQQKLARLMRRVQAAMPQWGQKKGQKLRLGDALDRFWPR
jgi:hypothetical protein